MITLWLILILFSSTLYAGYGNRNSNCGTERNYITYTVSKKSWTALSGTTNVNSFECLSQNGISSGVILTYSDPGDKKINFSDAQLLMEVNSFDCKNPLITRDMYKALGGDMNSGIDIELIDANLEDGSLSSAEGAFIANAMITINGKSNMVELMIDWHRSELMEYHFEGKADLAMSDFGITPPEPALGMVKVNDEITVQFNYVVQPGVISSVD